MPLTWRPEWASTPRTTSAPTWAPRESCTRNVTDTGKPARVEDADVGPEPRAAAPVANRRQDGAGQGVEEVDSRDEHADRGPGSRRIETARDHELLRHVVELELDAAGGVRSMEVLSHHVVERERLARPQAELQDGRRRGAGVADEAAIDRGDEELGRVGRVEGAHVGVEGRAADDRGGRRKGDVGGRRGGHGRERGRRQAEDSSRGLHAM